ncbi:MAG TPA: hypothetical protein VD651_00990 [Nitrosarchaeum sp.]|nr:hypothetical protein [Nitrosarchaeum sp.]
MSKLNSKTIAGIKYIYLIVFFALLAGFFHPIITHTSFESVILGVLILFVGLAGGVLVYKALTSYNKKGFLFGGGFALVAISLYFVFQMTGRIG